MQRVLSKLHWEVHKQFDGVDSDIQPALLQNPELYQIKDSDQAYFSRSQTMYTLMRNKELKHRQKVEDHKNKKSLVDRFLCRRKFSKRKGLRIFIIHSADYPLIWVIVCLTYFIIKLIFWFRDSKIYKQARDSNELEKI